MGSTTWWHLSCLLVLLADPSSQASLVIIPPTGTYIIDTNCNTNNIPQIDDAVASESGINEYTYKCIDGWRFMTGNTSAKTTCVSGTWSNVFDMCEEDCPVPRHCSDLFQLGLKTDGIYNVVPSGDAGDPSVKVSCVDAVGGGWTEVIRERTVSHPPDINLPERDYRLDMDSWHKMSHPTNESSAAVVMKINITLPGGTAHAVYDNVTIGPAPGYKLLSIGNYHGNAGDALCPSLGVEFIKGWWIPLFSSSPATTATATEITKEGGAFVSDLIINWGDILAATAIFISIRTSALDRNFTCPAMIEANAWNSSFASTTDINEKFLRVPNETVTYTCKNEFMMEGQIFENRTWEGNVICLDTAPPMWDREITLPCTFGCPYSYNESRTVDECYKFINEKAIKGYLEASYKCVEENGGLLRMGEIREEANIVTGNEYITAHSTRYGYLGEGPNSTSSSSLSCSGVCSAASNPDSCQVLVDGKTYKPVPCNDSRPYVCMIPAQCPQNFSRPYNGGACYRLQPMSFGASPSYFNLRTFVAEAVAKCNSERAGLARPTNMDVFMKLVSFVKSKSTTDTTVLLGLSEYENSSYYGIGDADPSFQQFWTNQTLGAVSLVEVKSTSDYTFYAQSSKSTTNILCQWPGPLGCRTPPQPRGNMTFTWAGINSTAANTTAEFICLPGYFVDGNTSRPVGQEFKCVGHMGEWWGRFSPEDKLTDCIRVPACTNHISIFNTSLTSSINKMDLVFNEAEYVGGNISYNCPTGKAVNDANKTQQQAILCTMTIPTNIFVEKPTFSLTPSTLQACQLCVDPPPPIRNSTNNFSNTTNYEENNSFVDVTCVAGYEIQFGVSSLKLNCIPTGWNMTGITNCSLACLTSFTIPAAIGTSHMTVSDNYTQRSEGTVANYTCAEGYFLSPTMNSSDLYGMASVTCNGSAVWEKSPPNFQTQCYHICSWKGVVFDDAYDNFNNSVSYDLYRSGSTLVVRCNEGYLWAFGNRNQIVTCTNKGWNTTQLEPCYRACYVSALKAEGTNMERATVTTSIPGTKIVYNCSLGYAMETLLNNGTNILISEVTATCYSNSSWEMDYNIPQFNCIHLCTLKEPTVVNAVTNYQQNLPHTHTLNGYVTATCNESHEWALRKTQQNITCEITGWNTNETKSCYKICASNPPAAGNNALLDVITSKIPGTKVNYTCDPGYWFNTTGIEGVTKLNVTYAICNASGSWEMEHNALKLDCLHPCHVNEPVIQNAITNFDITKDYSHTIASWLTAICQTGYEWASGKTSQGFKCSVTGWDLQNIVGCHIACLDKPLTAGPFMEQENVTQNVVNTTLLYTCAPDYYVNTTEFPDSGNSSTSDDFDLQNSTYATCFEDGHWHMEHNISQPRCYHRCVLDKPSVGNAVTNFFPDGNYSHNSNSTVTATCLPGYEWSLHQTNQTLSCASDGWIKEGISDCYLACTEDIIEAGDNMTVANVTVNTPNTTLFYNCSKGYYLETKQEFPNITNWARVTCSRNGTWEYDREDLTCVQLCLNDPPAAVGNSTMDWDNVTRLYNHTITYTCPSGGIFVSMQSTLNISCDQGNWTKYSEWERTCGMPCDDQEPPVTIGNAAPRLNFTGYREFDTIVYQCPPKTATIQGELNATLQCLPAPTDWKVTSTNETIVAISARFNCTNACPGPPVAPHTDWSSNYSGSFLEGVVVKYVCANTSSTYTGEEVMINRCQNNTWSFLGIPYCLTTTSAGPTTPPPLVLPTKPPVDPSYSLTTDQYYGTLQSNMSDTDGVNTTYKATDAPFGFGYAVLLESDKKQCLKQDSFNVPNGTKPCMSDPLSCNTEGISFSIWERHYFSADIFSRYNDLKDSDIKYVLSTGGDDNGHPGIALYHHGIYQIAIVSTGSNYWKVRVPGQMFNGSWCNIGIRWNPNVKLDANGVPISGGLHMLINLKVVGHSYLPVAVTPKPGLSPPELMLGCHKTQTDKTYRHFGDGEYDELASWNHALAENETYFFLGGYEGNFSNVTPEQLAQMLERVNLKDPDQFAATLTILGKMTQNNEKPTSAPDTTASSTSVLDTSPTPSGPNQLSALSEAQSLQRREALLDIMNTILNPANLGDPDAQLTKAQGVPYLDTLDLASNLFDMNSVHEWHNIQKNGSAGAADLMWKLDQFIKTAFCKIRYDNETAPLTVVKSTKNIIFVGQKMLVEDLKGKGSHVELPDFNMKELKGKKGEWNNIYDSIRVPTGVLDDDRCDKRPICVITMVYDTYDNVGPSPVNFANIPRNTVQKMDSRLISFKLDADKGRKPMYTGVVDKSAPLCWPDPIVLTKDPFYFRLEHNTPTVSVNRGLKFHSEEVITQVLDRRCAWWNANLSDYGVFDSTGCEIVETSAFSTSCICSRFGIVVVLSEQVKPAEVPPEAYWLSLVKYVLYGISGVLLIFYSVVVLYSPVLKEQFHLLGMNLSLAVLLGSIFMCVSDIQSIRESRHMCTTISTLIHFFYVAAGGLVACLGHSSFKAITSGVVGGKLNSYACISWGLALVSVGVPFAFFITDLGTDPRCFISWENYGKAAFFLPQMVYVVIAFFFGFVVLCNLSTPALRKENLIEDFGSFCRGASFLMIYFAITWSLGVPAYMRFDLTTDCFPMFQIMNSMTGIIIFLFIGLASNRYRGVLVGKAKAKQQKILSLAAGKGAGGNQKLKKDPPPPPPKPVAPADQASSRPSTGASLMPPTLGQVAGRPGSRPVTPQL